MLDQIIRPELMKMLIWHIAIQTGFQVNPGKFGKHFQQYLEPELWDLLLTTYTDADYKNTWRGHQQMCILFRNTAHHVADHFQFTYPHQSDTRVSAYLSNIKNAM